MRRSSCAACGGALVDFLDLGASPLADRFPQNMTATERWYPLEVAVCPGCWLVQLREIVPDDELYGSDYAFHTGSSPAAVDYFAALAAQLLTYHGDLAKRLTVEIACNDGTLLRHFADAGCRAIGIEPSGVRPRETGIGVIPRPFSSSLATALVHKGTAGLVIACNVIAHVADPRDFLVGIWLLLADDGIAVVEFQDVAALIAGCQYDHVYHEHRQFFSLGSFSRLARGTGLEIFDWERTPAQGGSMRVYLRRGRASATVVTDPWLEAMAVYETMQDRVRYARTRLNALVGAELNEDRIIAGYGASAKSCTLLNFCGLGYREVRWMEDLTMGKIGRLTPGSHIPVQAPGYSKADTYLLTSWNYVGRVIRNEAEFLAGRGRIIVPGAVPVIV
jgi:SAM-dependent methyltransferase